MKLRTVALAALALVGPAAAQTNVTLEMELDTGSAYIDSQEVTTSTVDNDLSFGYASTDQPVGVISYYGAPVQAKFSDGESLSLTSNLSETGSEFVVPNTRGGVSAIEDRRSSLQEHRLLSKINPSISFQIGADRLIRVSYDIPYEVHSFNGSKTGIDDLLIRNRIHSGSQTELILKAK
ncbi:MAG: hypothetical protein ABEJ03_03025 [Candidatus Nanohaloarchaea archaeon]